MSRNPNSKLPPNMTVETVGVLLKLLLADGILTQEEFDDSMDRARLLDQGLNPDSPDRPLDMKGG